MGSPGPPYSPEFRAEAVRMLRTGSRTVAELSRELGVSEATLRRWRRQAGDGIGEVAGPAIDEPPGPPEPEPRESRPSGGPPGSPARAARPPRLPAHARRATVQGGGRGPRRLAVEHRGKDRSVRMLARLTADVIDVGILVVTAPAKWAASGLRWYAGRGHEPPAVGE